MKNVLLLFTVLLIWTVNVEAQQKLTKNVKVPNISTKDATGENVNLQKILKENDRVLICFFRPVWCPICNKHTHDLIARYEELQKKGIEVVAIYPSNAEVMAQYVKDSKIPFPVISDPNEELYKRYAIERSLQKMRATLDHADAKEEMEAGVKLFHGKNYEKKEDERYDSIINADFVVKANRILEVAYYGDYIGDHYDLNKL
ncbi:MAG: peroxiredoxin-like family protein [Aureispira sp.]